MEPACSSFIARSATGESMRRWRCHAFGLGTAYCRSWCFVSKARFNTYLSINWLRLIVNLLWTSVGVRKPATVRRLPSIAKGHDSPRLDGIQVSVYVCGHEGSNAHTSTICNRGYINFKMAVKAV